MQTTLRLGGYKLLLEFVSSDASSDGLSLLSSAASSPKETSKEEDAAAAKISSAEVAVDSADEFVSKLSNFSGRVVIRREAVTNEKASEMTSSKPDEELKQKAGTDSDQSIVDDEADGLNKDPSKRQDETKHANDDSGLTEEVKALRRQTKFLQDTKRKLQDGNSSLEKRLETRSLELANVREQLKNSLASSKKKQDNFRTLINDSDTRVVNLQKLYDEAIAEITDLRGTVADLTDEIALLKDERGDGSKVETLVAKQNDQEKEAATTAEAGSQNAGTSGDSNEPQEQNQQDGHEEQPQESRAENSEAEVVAGANSAARNALGDSADTSGVANDDDDLRGRVDRLSAELAEMRKELFELRELKKEVEDLKRGEAPVPARPVPEVKTIEDIAPSSLRKRKRVPSDMPVQRPICTVKGCHKEACVGDSLCKQHGGQRFCQFPGCDKGACGRASYCAPHRKIVICQQDGCTKGPVFGSAFCRKHGGGNQCWRDGCERLVRGTKRFCIDHGGNVCAVEGCGGKACKNVRFCERHHTNTRKAMLAKAHAGESAGAK